VQGVVCRERPTHMVGRKLGVANGGHTLTPHRVALILNREQGDDGVTEDRQVVVTELREGPMGSSLQSVVEVIASSPGKPSHHGWLGGVSQNVHMDLATPQPELMVRVVMVCGNPCVAKVVQHVPEQGGKTGAVRPVTTEPSIGCDGGVGVVIHLSKTREKRINISSIEQRQQTKTINKPRRQQNFNSDSVSTDDDLTKVY
jgi:hypothetical protein